MDNKPAVLIVDDDEGMCRTLNLLLQWKGYHLATAGTGEAALALARQRFFNVALVDIRLPDMTGTDLLAQLKKLHPDLEVLLITGYATLDSAIQALAEGAYRYLTKPLNVDVLLAAIREALEKQRLTIKNRELLQEVQQELAERQRAEETLANERNLLRTLIDNLPDFIYVKDTASRFLVANTALARLMGAVTPDELLGKTDADFYPQELAAQFHADDQRIIRSGQPLINREEPLMDLATGKAGWLSTSKVPLRDSQGKIVGIVGIGHDVTERKRAEEEIQRRAGEMTALYEISLRLATAGELPDLLQAVVRQAASLLQTSGGCLYLYDQATDELELVVTQGIVTAENLGTRLQPGEGLAGRVMQKQRPLKVEDYQTWEGRSLRYEGQPFTAVAAVPLLWQDQLIGVLDVLDDQERRIFDEHDVRLLTLLAQQAAATIANARLLQAEQKRAGQLAVVNELGRSLAATLDLPTVGRTAYEYVRRLVDCPYFGISLFDPQQQTITAAFMLDEGQDLDLAQFPPLSYKPQARTGRSKAIASGQPVIVHDLRRACQQSDHEVYHIGQGPDALSALYVPMIVEGQVIGLLEVQSYQEDAYRQEDVELLTSVANHIGLAIQNARLLETLTKHREELQTLSTELMNAQEEERKRISQELHDEMGQALTAMHINLTVMGKELPPEAVALVRERLEETVSLVDQTLAQVRELALDLRPSMLDDIGLLPTLRWYVSRYAKRMSLEIELQALGLEDRLPAEMETLLYRAVQEALTNVARHAQASRVNIRLERKSSTVSTFIQDDGRGFDAEELAQRPPSARGVGLLGMRERVAGLGGSLSIHSHPGQGTRLSIIVPLPHGEGS